MAAVTEVQVSVGNVVERAPSTSNRPVPLVGLVAAYVTCGVLVTRWLVRIWRAGAEARPVLRMFEAEAGRTLTADEWYLHKGARAVFCPHPDADPSTSPVGKFIDAGSLYGYVLGLFAAGTFVAVGLLTLAASGMTRGAWRRAFVASSLLICVSIVVTIVAQADTIAIMTEVLE